MTTKTQRNLNIILVLALTVFLFVSCGREQQQEDVSADSMSIYAFVNVNLVPMSSETILEGMTVIIKDNIIDQIGKASKVKIPKGTVEIDGTGKFLMPGLADMHVHAWSENDLLLFIANGITTIRNMWGSPMHLRWKELIANGELLSPSLITAGPLLDGPEPIWEGSVVIETPEQAAKEVAAQKQAGYDFIKVYNKLSREVFDAILAAAKEQDIPVAGHVPYAVELEHVLESGMAANEHLTGYREMLEADDSPLIEKTDLPSRIMRWEYIDESKIPAAVSATLKSDIWNCVTLVVYQGFVPPEETKELLKRPTMKYVDPITLASWDPKEDFRLKDLTEEHYQALNKGVDRYFELTRALHEAGGRILLGTDTPNPFVVPGFSIHQELQNLVDCGMTPFEAIKAGTKDAAEFLGQQNIFGTIEEGKRADLILVKEDPLEDVANVAKRAGVMLRGQWFPEEKLQNMLDELVASYTAPKDRFADVPPLTTEGERVFEGRYEMTYNDTPMGEERLAIDKIEGSKRVVLAQGVTDPPYQMTTSMRLEYDESGQSHSLVYEEMTSVGKNQITMNRDGSKLIVTGTLVSGEKVDLEEAVAEDVLLSASMTGAFVPIVELAKKLEVGQTIELKSKALTTMPSFQIGYEKTIMKRADDEVIQTPQGMISMQVYNLKVTTETTSYDSNMMLDKEGRLFSLEIKSQMGSIKFNRIE